MATNYRDKSCRLECKDGVKEPIHEFIGPVKIIFVDPPRVDYWHKLCAAPVITCAYLLLIATVVTIFYYTLTFKLPIKTNAHVAACTAGLVLLMPSAVLMQDPTFGGGMHLDPSKKNIQHVMLQAVGTTYNVGGVLYLARHRKLLSNLHGIIGSVTMLFVFVSVVLGAFSFLTKLNIIVGTDPHIMKLVHRSIGMLTLVLSAATFCTGVYSPVFVQWCNESRLLELPHVLTGFCIVYTLCILMSIKVRWFLSF